MITDLLNQLRLCTVTGSLHTLFAHPLSTFSIFCPHYSKTDVGKGKLHDDTDNGKQPYKKDKKNSITNTTGRKFIYAKRHDRAILF